MPATTAPRPPPRGTACTPRRPRPPAGRRRRADRARARRRHRAGRDASGVSAPPGGPHCRSVRASAPRVATTTRAVPVAIAEPTAARWRAPRPGLARRDERAAPPPRCPTPRRAPTGASSWPSPGRPQDAPDPETSQRFQTQPDHQADASHTGGDQRGDRARVDHGRERQVAERAPRPRPLQTGGPGPRANGPRPLRRAGAATTRRARRWRRRRARPSSWPPRARRPPLAPQGRRGRQATRRVRRRAGARVACARAHAGGRPPPRRVRQRGGRPRPPPCPHRAVPPPPVRAQREGRRRTLAHDENERTPRPPVPPPRPRAPQAARGAVPPRPRARPPRPPRCPSIPTVSSGVQARSASRSASTNRVRSGSGTRHRDRGPSDRTRSATAARRPAAINHAHVSGPTTTSTRVSTSGRTSPSTAPCAARAPRRGAAPGG